MTRAAILLALIAAAMLVALARLRRHRRVMAEWDLPIPPDLDEGWRW